MSVEALKIKPEESYPQNMIIRINEIILKIQTDEINLEESYVKAINNGDKYFVEKDFIQAKAFFEKALSLKSEEPYPQIKINEINKILETAEKTENDYRKAVAHADSLFDKTNWYEALDQYYKASELKPEEPYPHEKINAINLILFKNLDEEYQSAIQLGDELLSQNNLEQALDHFKKAVELKPDQIYRNSECDSIIDISCPFHK
jgi:tetratricopeptide (TPR) repeat protein